MKFLALLLLSNIALADSPFHQYEEDRFRPLENEYNRKYVLNIYQSFASGDTIILGYLPPNAIITQSWIQTETAMTSASDNTIAIGCDSATDILGYTDFTDDAANDIIAGSQTGAASAMNYTAGCAVTATIGASASGSSGISAGKVVVGLRVFSGE